MLLMRKLREDERLSRNEVARRSKLDPSDYGKIERAILRPSPGQLKKLARVFRRKPSEASSLLSEV
jgi:transcriptional regulator with XRE-family HTH domain